MRVYLVFVLLATSNVWALNRNETLTPKENVVWQNGTLLKHDHHLFILNSTGGADVLRVIIGAFGATTNYPLLTVIQETKSVLSWTLPIFLQENVTVNKVARTLCPFEHDVDKNEISVELSTSSLKPIKYFFAAIKISHDNFHLTTERSFNLTSTPSEPQFLRYTFPSDLDEVIVKVESSDDSCMIVSIQPVSCPVYDLAQTVEYNGIHQTMSTQAAIHVFRKEFNSDFYVVFVVLAQAKDSCGTSKKNEANALSVHKRFSVTIQKPITNFQFHLAIWLTIGILLAMYILTLGSSFMWKIVCKKAIKQQFPQHSPASKDSNEEENNQPDAVPANNGVNSVAQMEIEQENAPAAVIDAEVRKAISTTVGELSKKPWRQTNKKYSLYHWNVWIISIFYIPPVVQLVLGYQKVMVATGDEDLCYYNFLCAVPLGNVAAFNNIFSNIGYVMLGLLFLIHVYIRDREYQLQNQCTSNIEITHGIPGYFGLFYAIGTAMMIEGVMSASYHVCPNFSNFQFDTAFMYIISALGILKIYQKRHPDVNAGSHVTFVILALVVLLSVIGVSFNSLPFWIIFACCYFLLLINLTAELYYKGKRHIGLNCCREIKEEYKETDSSKNFLKPSHPDRIVFLVLGNLLNIAL